MPVMAHLLMSVFKMTSCPEFIGKANGMVVMAHGPLNHHDTDLNFLRRSMVVMGHCLS